MDATKLMKANTAKPSMVEFECRAPEARQVCVAGTFNEWKPDATPLVRDKAGNWRGSVKLQPGHHEFKFIVDGKWCCEPGCEHEYSGCPKCCTNGFGTINRVLDV